MIQINLDKKVLVDLEKHFKSIMDEIDNEFLVESAKWLIERANNYLDERTHFRETTTIRDNWEYRLTDYKTIILENTSQVGVLVEFGTGLVGKTNPHPLANHVGYKYDVNKHGFEGWNFVRDLSVVEFNPSLNHDQNIKKGGNKLIMFHYKGYVGKEFFYNAMVDYFVEAPIIYEQVFNKHFGAND